MIGVTKRDERYARHAQRTAESQFPRRDACSRAEILTELGNGCVG